MYFLFNSADGFRTPAPINIDKSFCTDQCLKQIKEGKLQCTCGEDTDLFDWSWQNENASNVKMSEGGREVLFHPVYSAGTAAVRGDTPFQQNYHYYWEIKMISKLYGTDVMIGVGTSKIVFSDWKFKFGSLLGTNSESWGYSYHGNIQHRKNKRTYGKHYGLGSIIGVHLDMVNGTLEYFLNRKSLGVAFTGLKGKELYPMVCSTAAQSAVKITCCMSKESTLQMLCLKNIMKHPKLLNQYRNIPGLTRTYDKQYFWMQPQPESDEKKRLADLDDVDESCIKTSKRFKASRLLSLLYDEEELQDERHNNDNQNFDGTTDDNSNDSNAFTGIYDNLDAPASNDTSSTSEQTHSEPETCDWLNFACKLCGGKHRCKYCALQLQLQEDDSSSECSGISEDAVNELRLCIK